MDPALAARLEQVRTYTQEVAGARFTVRRPTVEAFRLWLEAERGGAGAEHSRQRLAACIVGWSGVTLRHFGDDSDEEVAFSKETAEALLADAPVIALALLTELVRRVDARALTLGADEKNSSSASTAG